MRVWTSRMWWVVIAMVGCCACGAGAGTAMAPEPATMSSGMQRVLRTEIRTAAERQEFRGALLVLVGGTNVIAEGFGPRFPDARPGTEESKAITAESLFEVASISKGFTVIAVFQLVEQGKLKLDDPISTFFPEELKPGTRVGDLTLKQLLSHTTGLDGNTGLVSYPEPSRQRMLSSYASAKERAPAGTTWGYHNASYNVVAAIIEKVSGQTFSAYMREKVFVPAGMNSTGILGDKHLDRSRAISRCEDPGARTSLDWPCGWGYLGAGGVVTSLRDLMAFEKALAEDVLISRESKGVMFTPVVKVELPGSQSSYALGWFVDEPVPARAADARGQGGMPARPRCMQHGGSVRGVRAWWVYDPERRVLIGAFGDESSDPRRMVRACEKLVLTRLAGKE